MNFGLMQLIAALLTAGGVLIAWLCIHLCEKRAISFATAKQIGMGSIIGMCCLGILVPCLVNASFGMMSVMAIIMVFFFTTYIDIYLWSKKRPTMLLGGVLDALYDKFIR